MLANHNQTHPTILERTLVTEHSYPPGAERYFVPDHSALEVADLMGEAGFRTLWIKPGSKAPGLVDWPNKASSDGQDHVDWFERHPERGLGWAMGPQDNGRFLVALDIDIVHGGGESLAIMDKDQKTLIDDMLRGWLQRTGSGGFHYVFEVPAEVGSQMKTSANLLPGIDIRGAGGQICVYPTRHPNGAIYRWREGGEPWT